MHYALDPVPSHIDKDYLACDQRNGDLYLAYINIPVGSDGSQVELVRSADGGRGWSFPPTVVEADDRNSYRQGPYPAVGPDGSVYVMWFEQSQPGDGAGSSAQNRIQLRKSVDSAATFPAKTQVAFTTEPLIDEFNLPSISIDTSGGAYDGNVYVVFTEADQRDIKLARSTDGGLSFDLPVRVNDDPPGADHFLPWVTVDASDGTVSVIWYDRRFNGPGGPGWTDLFLAQSTDGGATWSRNQPITDVPSLLIGRQDTGDYINAVAADGILYAAWADLRNGDPDVFFARVPPLRR